MPAPSGRPELNFYASRSTIDTGVTTLLNENLYNTNGNSLDRQDVQQDITINSALGSRLSIPLNTSAQFQSGFSAGFDYKEYELTSYKTNIFTLTSEILDTISNPGHVITNINVSTVYSPVPTTVRSLDYLPLSLRYDASLRDSWGVTAFGLGLSANAWYSGSASNLQSITGSSESSGHWVILSPSMSRDFLIHTNWVLSLHAEGQWASEPLISNEQFGLGGVNSVRGYQEGRSVWGYRLVGRHRAKDAAPGDRLGLSQSSAHGARLGLYGIWRGLSAGSARPPGRHSRFGAPVSAASPPSAPLGKPACSFPGRCSAPAPSRRANHALILA